MNQNNILEATRDLLREAEQTRNQLCKMKSASGGFVRAKRSYVEPEDVRTLYLAAFDSLCSSGKVKKVLENPMLELYEINGHENGHKVTLEGAIQDLIENAKRHGPLFKLHSPEGEFVQCGGTVYLNTDDERIIYLEALYELLHHGRVEVISDDRTFASFTLSESAQMWQ